MPVVEVKLYEERLTDELAAQLIEKMTDALVECTSEQLRGHTWVIVTARTDEADIVQALRLGAVEAPAATPKPPIAGVTLPS